MMFGWIFAIGLLQILIWLFFLGAIIYLIIRRIEKKKEETFEDRDN